MVMPSGDWIYWIAWPGIAAINIAFVYIAWRALFADRANGRRRCPRCWYDLSYSPGMTCGECGYTAVRERQFSRTRRRYGQGAAAMLACAALAGTVHYHVSSRGWVSMAPTKALIWSLPFGVSEHSAAFSELNRRINAQSLSDWEWSMLVSRCAAGEWGARPPSADWARKYGLMIERWRRAFAPSRSDPNAPLYSDLELPLLDIPPLVRLSVPRDWPRGTPPAVQLHLREWWPARSDVRVVVEGSGGQVVLRRGSDRTRSSASFAAPVTIASAVNTDEFEIVLDVTVQRRRGDEAEEWATAHEQQFSFPVTFHDSPNELLEATTDKELTEDLQRTFAGLVVAWSGGPSPVRFRYNPTLTHTEAFDDTAIGVSLELRVDDQLARQLNMWWLAGTNVDEEPAMLTRGRASNMETQRGRGRSLGWEVVYEDRELLAQLAPDDPRWQMHVRGSLESALRVAEAARYWQGSFTVPIEMQQVDRSAPAPDWWIEQRSN